MKTGLAGKLIMPKLSVETMNDEQGPSGSGKNEERDDVEKKGRQPKEPMEQDPDRAGRDGSKTSTGDSSSLVFKVLDEDEEGRETLAGTTEPAEHEISMLEPPSAFMNAAQYFAESCSAGKIETTTKIP